MSQVKLILTESVHSLGEPGDLVIAVSYAPMTPEEADAFQPITVHVDQDNRIAKVEVSGPEKLPETLFA